MMWPSKSNDNLKMSVDGGVVVADPEGLSQALRNHLDNAIKFTGDALELKAEMPGIDGRNASVVIEDDVLTISGEQREEETKDDARTERWISFYRQIPLPDDIDTEQAQASYRDGVLTVRFPKTRARSRAREIPVSTEQTGQAQSGQPQSVEQQAQQRAA